MQSTHNDPCDAIRARIARRHTAREFHSHHGNGQDREEEQQQPSQQQQLLERTATAITTSSLPETPFGPWSFVIRTLLCGTHDCESPLHLLNGFEATLLRRIYEIVVSTWIDLVQLTPPAYSVGRMGYWAFVRPGRKRHSTEGPFEREREEYGGARLVHVVFHSRRQFSEVGPLVADRPQIAFSPCGQVEFPSPQDINVNMLPFVLGDSSSLPVQLLPYYSLIEKCRVLLEEMGKVCYLTISESHVDGDTTQRRGGLHIEAPNMKLESSFFVAGKEYHWGHGFAFSEDELHGGLYMASSVSNTCAVYNSLIDKKGVNSQGGMDHLRGLIGEPTLLEANELVWLTDCTPHEALPQEEPGYRQFFRLVTSMISLWYEGNSTANPKVPLPDYVQVIPGSKFEKE